MLLVLSLEPLKQLIYDLPLLVFLLIVSLFTNDHQYQSIPEYNTTNDYHNYSSMQIRELIAHAGIVGLGGAGFPSAIKNTPKDDDSIKYVIIQRCRM